MAINKAIISEKSFMAASASKYTFIVSNDMNKDSVKAAIEKIYPVKVEKVNIIRIIGKTKRNKKGEGKRSDYKKAIVSLSKKDLINLFDVEGDKADNKKAKKDVGKTKDKNEVKAEKEVKTVIREPKRGLLGGRTTNK